MARKNSTRREQGSGTIRQKTVTRNGKEYVFWEARVTVGSDPGTGKQKQVSFSGKTQKEVAEKMRLAAVEIEIGTFVPPNKIKLSEWLDKWESAYLGDVKPFTRASYHSQIVNHLKPGLGAVRLQALSAPQIQEFYNGLSEGDNPLSAKTIKNIHGVLHRALKQAQNVGYIRFNPADAVTLPRVIKKEMHPLNTEQVVAFKAAIAGHPFENIYLVTMLTGMREGEVLGLKWDCVNFESGTITIREQLQKEKRTGGQYVFASLKNDKTRVIAPASYVMKLLRRQKSEQAQAHLKAGQHWQESGLVFTNEYGQNLAIRTVYNNFKRIVASIGAPEVRFHDLRHTYAFLAIRAGDDWKTISGNLGHATVHFTIDVYGHLMDEMRMESSKRMDRHLEAVLGL